MFSEFNKDYYEALNKVREAAEALEIALKTAEDNFHSNDMNIADTEDLSAFDYFLHDLDGFVKDDVVPLLQLHEEQREVGRPPQYQFDTGLKYGSYR